MESQPLPGRIPQNYKGRDFFTSGSSSYPEERAEEILPPDCWISSSKSVKLQKKMTEPDVICIDLDDNSSDGVAVVDGMTDRRKDKGKAQMTGASNDHYNSVISSSGNWIPCYTVSSDSETHSESNDSDDIYCWEDDPIVTSQNDDKLALFQAHLDSMDIPAGVEVAMPWFPDYEQNMNVQSISIDLNSSKAAAAAQSSATPMGMVDSEFQSLPTKNIESSSTVSSATPMGMLDKEFPSLPNYIESSSRVSSSRSRFHKSISKVIHGEVQSSLKLPPPPLNLPPAPLMPNHPIRIPFMSQQPYLNYSVPFSFSSGIGSNPHPLPNPGYFSPVWPKYGAFGQDQYNISNDATHTNLVFDPVNIPGATLFSTSTGVVHEEPARPVVSLPSNFSIGEILSKYQEFKRFDTVEDYSDHHFAKYHSERQPSKTWAKKMQEEWRVLEKDLPDKIFVRVYESRMDLLRAVIVGAEGTPYHDGLFFFDIYFSVDYPNVPPNVHYHSGGLRINPNLYNCGKVCLSLLNTWSGSGNEKWVPGLSTMLQVLVSIQALVLNAKPYFNEPGYASSEQTAGGEKRSLSYNDSTFSLSLKTILYTLRRPAKYFEDLIFGHFFSHGEDILAACEAYKSGAPVGSFTKNQASTVTSQGQSSMKCSASLKHSLETLSPQLVEAFTKIGLKDCQKFLIPPPPPPPTAAAAPVPKKKQRMAAIK